MRLHLVHLGQFAKAVSDRTTALAESHQVLTSSAADPRNGSPAFWPSADLRVLIVGRESPALLRGLDKTVRETRTPAAVVCLDHPRLRLGPLVMPDAGPCLGCMLTRRTQHDPSYAKAAALYSAYDTHLELEPAGYLAHHVEAAARWITAQSATFAAGRPPIVPGQVSHLNLHTGHMTRDTVVGIHGCPVCRTTAPLSSSTWEALARDLSTTSTGTVKHV